MCCTMTRIVPGVPSCAFQATATTTPSVEQEEMRRNLVLPRDGMTGWPNLHGADVKIVITGSRQYELHSNVLGNSSNTVAGLMLASNPDRLEERTIKSGRLIAYRHRRLSSAHKLGGDFVDDTEVTNFLNCMSQQARLALVNNKGMYIDLTFSGDDVDDTAIGDLLERLSHCDQMQQLVRSNRFNGVRIPWLSIQAPAVRSIPTTRMKTSTT